MGNKKLRETELDDTIDLMEAQKDWQKDCFEGQLKFDSDKIKTLESDVQFWKGCMQAYQQELLISSKCGGP